MAKDTRAKYEVIDEKKVQEVVELLVDFAESKKLPAKIVMVAMEHIVSKIKNHLGLETITVLSDVDTLH